jgi:hypothetical protein
MKAKLFQMVHAIAVSLDSPNNIPTINNAIKLMMRHDTVLIKLRLGKSLLPSLPILNKFHRRSCMKNSKNPKVIVMMTNFNPNPGP